MKDIIFDVDGTLWDTTDVVAKAWNKAVEKTKVNREAITGDLLKKEFGKPMNVIADDLFPELDEETKQEIMRVCCEYEHGFLEAACTEEMLYEGVRETFAALAKRCRICIVSNCQCGYIELFLQKTGLEDCVTDIECYGNTLKSKGENIKAVVLRNHLEDPVYVGDTAGDYEASVEAGVPFILAAYGFGDAADVPAIGSIKELL